MLLLLDLGATGNFTAAFCSFAGAELARSAAWILSTEASHRRQRKNPRDRDCKQDRNENTAHPVEAN